MLSHSLWFLFLLSRIRSKTEDRHQYKIILLTRIESLTCLSPHPSPPKERNHSCFYHPSRSFEARASFGSPCSLAFFLLKFNSFVLLNAVSIRITFSAHPKIVKKAKLMFNIWELQLAQPCHFFLTIK